MSIRTAGWFASLLTIALTHTVLIHTAAAQQNPDGRLPIGNYDQPLLLLLRDEEVLRELKVNDSQRSSLGKLADQVDALVWPFRNLSPERANAAWKEGTSLARTEGLKVLTTAQQRRMEEVILWIQGARALTREDVADKLQLNASQRSSIRSDVEATNKTIDELRKRAASGESAGPLEEKARQLKVDEQRRILERLTEEQRRSWLKLVGTKFDVSKLGRVNFRAPELVAGDSDWVNGSAALTHRERRVTVVHFFANGCINCQRNYEHYRAWQDAFRDQGLVIVGIHTPETKAEYDVDLLKRKVTEAGFKFPILVDNEKKNWDAWGNTMWPSVYLVDQQGRIRYWWYGELNWQGAEGEKRMRQRISELISEAKPVRTSTSAGAR